jgi:hypothetical protein
MRLKLICYCHIFTRFSPNYPTTIRLILPIYLFTDFDKSHSLAVL